MKKTTETGKGQPSAARPANMFDAGPLPAGSYQIEVTPQGLRRASRGQAKGFSFVVRVVGDGPHQGREQRVEILQEDPSGTFDGMIRRDLALLRRWLDGLGVGVVADPLAAVNALGKHGKNFIVVATFAHDEWKRRLDVYLADIDVQPKPSEVES